MQKKTNSKILFVIPTDIYGGGEVYMKNILSYNCPSIDKYVLSFNKTFLNLVANDIIHGEYIKFENSFIINKLKMIFYVNKIIRKYKINVVFLNGFTEAGTYSRFILAKTVSICHSNEYWLVENDFKSMLKRFLYLKIGCKLNKLIVINKLSFSHVNNINFLRSKTSLIYNGVDKIDISFFKDNNSDKVSIGRISRLCEGKGNNLLIKAFSEVLKKYPNINLFIAGQGPMESELRSLVNDLNICENVFFMGFIEPKNFFEKIDCMYSTSEMETLPLVILESFSCKKPVVSTKVGGVVDLIKHKSTGYLIEANSIDEIRDSMIYFLENRNEFNSYANKAYKLYLKKFTIDKMNNQTYQLLEDLINE